MTTHLSPTMTTTMMMNNASVVNELSHDQLKEICTFMLDYAVSLYGSGATCMRLEKNVSRIADACHVVLQITILPTHIHITIWDYGHSHSYSSSKKVPPSAISFYTNTTLSRLSWEIADERISFEQACKRFDDIVSHRPIDKTVVLLLTSCANASFCRLFGGDFTSMGIVFAATFCGFLLKQVMTVDKHDIRFTTFLAAFLSSVIGAAGYVFNIGATPELALGTSVLYLVPGIPYINSMSDLLDGHYICSYSRFIQSLILTFCLSLGLIGGFVLMNIRLF